MNFFPWHIGDYAAHTRNLSLLEDLAYRRLLDAYYLAEQPFNGSPTDVAREIGMRDQVIEVEYILGKFFERDGDVWRNKRADLEIAKYLGKKDQASRAGKASAERRSNASTTPVEEKSTPVDKTGNGRATNQEPRTKNQDTSGKGGKPPAEKAKAELWKAAVSLLEGQGMPESQARAFFGKLSKDYPDGEIVLDAVRGAVTEQPADARAYLKATCQRLAGEKTRSGAPDWTRTAT